MLRLHNVRVNNLKEVSLDIPPGQWLLFCGLSGSGKSSLAFDTLYAEGQRRYISCLSPQTRQFITQLDRPDADLIEGIPPAIAVQAFRGLVARKTTVGIATEISEHLRVLFCEVAIAVCPRCHQSVRSDNPESVADWLQSLGEGRRFQVTFVSPCDDWAMALMSAKRNGFARAIVGGTTIDLSRPEDDELAGQGHIDRVSIVVDRLKTGSLERSRLIESLEIAFQSGEAACQILIEPGGASMSNDLASAAQVEVGGKPWLSFGFGRSMNCGCGFKLEQAEPKLFAHTSKIGACDVCDGVGFTDKLDREICDACHGTRFVESARAYQIDGLTIADFESMTLTRLAQEVQSIGATLPKNAALATRWLRGQIETRLDYLQQVGLGYLSLRRPVRSLSAGEAQRVSLTSCLSSTLVNALYVLDEPSVGLHAADMNRLIAAIRSLHQRGNTMVVVDHDEGMIRAASRVVEVGPAAGVTGGEIVFDGTPEELVSNGETITADFLAGRRGVSWNQDNRRTPRGGVRLIGASGNNLRNLNVEFPLGCLTVVTGVSGAGKSSLVQQTLYGAVCAAKQVNSDPPLPYEEVHGSDRFDEIVMVDRSPIGRSARSNPVTYVKAFDDIRRCFADTMDAKSKNLNVSKFSFNAAGGRCDKCEGAGQLVIDMQFLPEVNITCDSCRGTRYRDEVLAVKYRGKNISDVLQMTVREAFSFFRGQHKVQAKLKALIDVGLDYVRLGQPANTLSSGEAQRLKLGLYLNSTKSKRALFLLDEPTTGLHMADVSKLLDCFDTLLSVGHSMIVVEHHLQLIRNADWVIDLGPGAAEAGGTVVVAGTPEDVAACKDSLTGKFLAIGME